MLIDTGASVSLICEEAIPPGHTFMDVRKVVSYRTTSASGHKLPIERSVLGIVTLGNIEIKQRF